MKKRKFKRKFKNPFKYPQHIDSQFFDYLSLAIRDRNPKWLSTALLFRKIGIYNCKDCGEDTFNCYCEGSYAGGNPCEDCDQNYCICGYNIQNEKDLLKVCFKLYNTYIPFRVLQLAFKKEENTVLDNILEQALLFRLKNIDYYLNSMINISKIYKWNQVKYVNLENPTKQVNQTSNNIYKLSLDFDISNRYVSILICSFINLNNTYSINNNSYIKEENYILQN